MITEEIKKEEIHYKQFMLHYEVFNLRKNKEEPEENPWHWHNEFEVCYVRSGKVLYRTTSNEYLLEKGDIAFINVNTIHHVQAIHPIKEMFLSVHIFDDMFLAGGRGNILDVKYVSSIRNSRELDIFVLRNGEAGSAKAAELMEKNIILKRDKPRFWEFDLRTNICELWKLIVLSVETNHNEVIPTVFNSRLSLSMRYIQEHYKEKVKLTDISNYSNISTRECNRMFMKYLNITPISYLHTIRIQRAMILLADMSKSIAEIAIEVGYNGSSHFEKFFKVQNNMTPMQYRKQLQIK